MQVNPGLNLAAIYTQWLLLQRRHVTVKIIITDVSDTEIVRPERKLHFFGSLLLRLKTSQAHPVPIAIDEVL